VRVKPLLALALLLIPTQAIPETPQTAPIDQVARAKFPNSDGELIDKLAMVNKIVNAAITRESDFEHYGVRERFVSWPADLKGDCEDYALTKMETLGNLGWPLIGNVRLDTVLVHLADGSTDGHAIAEYRLADGSVVILDSNFAEPMTRKELEAKGYVFFDWRA
jgi:predicted transglutaminase-like cysteine proteinase